MQHKYLCAGTVLNQNIISVIMMRSATVGPECGWWDLDIAGGLVHGGQNVTVDDV